MVRCTTPLTTGDNQNSIAGGAHGGSTLLEKVMKTIGKIAIGSPWHFRRLLSPRRQDRQTVGDQPSYRTATIARPILKLA
jgi:hypothetical protein